MKTTFLTWVVLMHILTSSVAKGDSFPTFLPLGNTMKEWVVTNSPVDIDLAISCTPAGVGGTLSCTVSKTGLHFESYASFESYVTSTCAGLSKLLETQTGASVSNNTACFVRTWYYESGQRRDGLGIDTSRVSSQGAPILGALQGSVPTIGPVTLPITNLSYIIIETGTERVVTTNTSPILDQSYASFQGRARFTLVTPDGTATYTQSGYKVTPPILTLWMFPQNTSYVYVQMTVGSDTTVESSTNMLSGWQKEVTFPWSLNSSGGLFPFDLHSQTVTPPNSQFWRAFSN